MNTDLTIQDQFNTVWNLVQSMPDEQRTAAEQAIVRAYNHATDNINALIVMADDLRLQRDIAINEIAFIQKHRGHISYDDVARDMSMEIDDLTYEDARNIVDVLCGMSDHAVSNWDLMDVREAIRRLVEGINENIAPQTEFD